jgi:uncharacterized protein (TIGR02117 family)
MILLPHPISLVFIPASVKTIAKHTWTWLKRAVLAFLVLLVSYGLFAFITPYIPVYAEVPQGNDYFVYVVKSGPHCDVMVPVKSDVHDWSVDFPFQNNHQVDTSLSWVAVGWGDEDFYMNTPTWADLTVKRALASACGLGTAAMHASFYREVPTNRPVIKLSLTEAQYTRLCGFIHASLVHTDAGSSVLLMPTRAGVNGDFDRYYDAHGTYSALYTCNTWVNDALIACGQKACLWTPFANGIFYQYGI